MTSDVLNLPHSRSWEVGYHHYHDVWLMDLIYWSRHIGHSRQEGNSRVSDVNLVAKDLCE